MKIQTTKNLNFGMKYKLSNETQQLLSKSTGMSVEQMRNEPILTKLSNKSNFYTAPSHCDFPVRNVLLAENKVLKLNKVKKYIKLMCLEYKFNETKNQIKELLFNKPINMFRKLGHFI